MKLKKIISYKLACVTYRCRWMPFKKVIRHWECKVQANDTQWVFVARWWHGPAYRVGMWLARFRWTARAADKLIHYIPLDVRFGLS